MLLYEGWGYTTRSSCALCACVMCVRAHTQPSANCRLERLEDIPRKSWIFLEIFIRWALHTYIRNLWGFKLDGRPRFEHIEVVGDVCARVWILVQTDCHSATFDAVRNARHHLAYYGNPFAQVFTRAHTHQFARTSLKRQVDTFPYRVPLYHLSNDLCS